jgi:hypothetical protein
MGRVRYTPNHVLQEVVLAMKLLRETWFGSDGQSQIHTQPYLEGSRVGEEAIGRDRDRMGRVRYTPNRVLKEVVVTKLLCEAWFSSDGQSQIHTQSCPVGSRVGDETLARDLVRFGWAESDTHPTVS